MLFANAAAYRARIYVQPVCHDTLPWLIFLTHDLPSSFALAGYPVYLADSQSARFSFGNSLTSKGGIAVRWKAMRSLLA
jgi:hypothetical protein